MKDCTDVGNVLFFSRLVNDEMERELLLWWYDRKIYSIMVHTVEFTLDMEDGTKTHKQLGQYANLAPGEGNQFQCSKKLSDA